MNLFKKLSLLCSVAFVCTTWQGKAQSNDERLQNIKAALPQIDQIFKEYAQKNHYPAFVYGLVLDGKLIHSGNIGYANLQKKIPANNQTDFRIASMSKSVTAMAILKLRDEGKLKLDDPAYLYVPELKSQHLPTKDAPAITIRNLLTHSAGFPEDNPWGDRQLAISDAAIQVQLMSTAIWVLRYWVISSKKYQEKATKNIRKNIFLSLWA